MTLLLGRRERAASVLREVSVRSSRSGGTVGAVTVHEDVQEGDVQEGVPAQGQWNRGAE